MKRLWLLNTGYEANNSERENPRRMAHKEKNMKAEAWGGYVVRAFLQAIYITSMLCLLRSDEALTIRWGDIDFEPTEDGSIRMKLQLPFRKTHQTGGTSRYRDSLLHLFDTCTGVIPFYLYPNHGTPWLCPIRAWQVLWGLMEKKKLEYKGYVFRKKHGFNNFSRDEGDRMVSTNCGHSRHSLNRLPILSQLHGSFLEYFRLNLQDLQPEVRTEAYGTHSFRRGGCQYLAMTLRWPIRNICTWGGWAENFDNPSTIFKYLLSHVDTPMMQHEDYFNPKRHGIDVCATCGRSCPCA